MPPLACSAWQSPNVFRGHNEAHIADDGAGADWFCTNRPDAKTCAPPPVTVKAGDMNGCIHLWAYRLASSPDAANLVAKAVVQACNDVANVAAESGGKAQAAKLGDDESRAITEAYRGITSVGEMTALFRVVQARAGHCKAP